MKTILALAMLASTASAHATAYRFTYTEAFGTITGVFRGALESDGDRILVQSVDDFVRVDVRPDYRLTFPSIAVVHSLFSRRPGYASLSGENMDFLADTQFNNGGDAFVFLSQSPNYYFVYAFGSGESGEAIFDPADWQISVVPEPATWTLTIAGFAVAGAALRRRRTAWRAA